MSVYLDEKEEKSLKEELEAYDRERQDAIDEERVNAKARRQKQDKLFRKVLFTAFAIVLVMLVISWAR